MSPYVIALLAYLSVALLSAFFVGSLLALCSASDRVWDGPEQVPDELESLLAAQPVKAQAGI